MSPRDEALALAAQHFDSGAFVRDLARRVAIRTESQDPASGPALATSTASAGFMKKNGGSRLVWPISRAWSSKLRATQ